MRAVISKIVGDDSFSVVPEDSDDLLLLRRVMRIGDRVAGDTTRVIKQDRDYSRPDRGERIHVRILVDVEKFSLDHVLDRIRVSGTILESSSDLVSHGSHHSMTIGIGSAITIHKKDWRPVERKLLRRSSGKCGFVLVAIDTSDCGIARLKGTHLEFLPNIYSGAGGKRYKTAFKPDTYMRQVQQAMASIMRKGDEVVVFGPGEPKKMLANALGRLPNHWPVRVVDGIDSGGEDGVYTFTRSQAMKEIMAGSRLAKVASIIDEVMSLAGKKSRKFTMGYEQTLDAVRAGAVQSLVFSDRAIQDNSEQDVIDLLNDAESGGADVYGADSSTDMGLRISGLGGIVSLLRFAMG